MPQSFLPFEDFLSHLQHQGFDLGVDDFLQVQTLLNRLPKDCSSERLKSLMCPLVVSNEEEQEYFYRAFDRYFTAAILKHEKLPDRNIETAKRVFEEEEKEDEKDWSETTHHQKYGDKMMFTFWGFVASHLRWIMALVVILIALFFWGLSNSSTSQSTPFVEQNTSMQQPQESEKPSTATPQKTNTSDTSIEETKPTNLQTTPSHVPNTKPSRTNPQTTPTQIEKPYKILFLNYWWLLWGILLVVSSFVLYRTFRKEQDGFYLELSNHLKPPHYWNIEVPKTELKLYRSSIFKQVSRELQQRQKTLTSKIDIPKTLTATIEAAGYPRFEYLQKSKLPEYLMLLPQGKAKDQKLQLFDSWYEVLKEQEVFVHRFFYIAHKPEWCSDEFGNLFHIKELYAQYRHCRLLAFVDLETSPLPPPKEGGISGGWGDVFGDWQEKVLLNTSHTSKAMQDWAVENDFLLMPANLQSLTELNRVLEGEKTVSTFRSIQKIQTKWENLSIVETLRELKRQLNEVSFKWLCATAIYPEMNWDLTVYIGEALFDERELVKEENVMPLVDLPWFRKGNMPENLRTVLAAQLDKHSQFLVKDALLHLLKINPLVGEEYGKEFFDYQLHIALEDVQLYPDDEYKLSTLKDLTEQEQFAKSSYQTVVLRYLERRKNIEGGNELGLGETLKKRFNREDIEVEEIVTSHKSERVTYVYPKARLVERSESVFVDLMFSVFVSLIMALFPAIFYFLFPVEIEIFVVLITGIVSLMYLSLDSWTKGSGVGKYGFFRVIDIHTNLPCSFWQSIVRRSFPFLLMLLWAIGEIYIGTGFTLFLCVAASFQYLLSFVGNKRGRKLTDYLAGTQVVRETDYQKGNFEIKNKKINEDYYVYPISNEDERIGANITDGVIIIIFSIFMERLYAIIFELIMKSPDLGFAVYIFTVSIFISAIDNFSGGGVGKSKKLMIVDLKTNKRSKWWKSTLRRIVDILFVFICWGFAYCLGLGTYSYWLILFVFAFVNLMFTSANKGRRLGDYLLDTQVINQSDFEEKNYTIVKKRENKVETHKTAKS